MDGMRGGNTTNTHGSFLMFPKVQQQQQQQQPQNYHHPYPQRQDAFASTGGIPDADVYEFLRRSVALTQGELRHYSPSESTPMSSSQSFVLSSTSLPSAIGYPRKKKRCSKKKKNGSFSNNNNNTGLGGIGGGGQSHLLFKHQQQQQQLLFPLVGTTPSSTSAMVCATESSLTHMNKKHHPNSTPSSMWNNTATHSSGTPPCTTTTTSAGGRKNISTAETAATTRTNATPCSYSSFPTRLLVRRHAVRPSVEEGISGTHIYAVRWWHPQDEEDANAHATRRTLAADRPEQSPPHTSKTNLRGGTTPRNPRPCDSVKFVRALSRTNQQSHFTTSIDDDEDVGVLQTAVSVVDDCTFELLGRSSSTASAAAVASTVSTRLVDGPQQPKQMQSEDRQQAPLLKAVTLEPAAAGDDNYIVAAMTTKAAMPSTTMTHNLQQSAKSGNSLATWNAISATDRATLDCVAKSYRRDDTDDDVMAHHSTTGCPESISVDLLFRPAAMAAPPRRKG